VSELDGPFGTTQETEMYMRFEVWREETSRMTWA